MTAAPLPPIVPLADLVAELRAMHSMSPTIRHLLQLHSRPRGRTPPRCALMTPAPRPVAAREVAATVDTVPPVLVLLDVGLLAAAGEGEGP